MEDIRNDFTLTLKENGIDVSKLQEDKLKNITKSKYNKLASEDYSIVVSNEDEAKLISNLELDGFKITSVDYIFESTYDQYFNEMTVAAIEDAKRKANNLAKSVGKTVGEILNIEDMKNIENQRKNSRNATKASTKTLMYRVNVTFELK